jgi:DNA-binding transcriptional regulator YdaS (Cro superfamily)
MVNERTNNAARAAAIDIPGSIAELARRIGVGLGSVQKYPALNRVPAEQVIPIERATGDKVTRYMLGPDLCLDQPRARRAPLLESKPMLKPLVAATILSGLSVAAQAMPITYTVGSGGGFQFATISAAVNNETAGNTYTINVSPGTYLNDFSVINQPTDIEAAGPGVILQATVPIPNSQGIIETFANLTVNGLTIIGALASDPNSSAAAIRDHNDGSANANTLIVENSLIENSQNGIQTQGSGNQENVTIKNDNFVGDGGPIGPAHALYIGDAATADIINSTFCGTVDGHDIKSRALSTTVTGSTMYIAATGTAGAGCSTVGSASAGIDLPNGGVGDIFNDTIIQGTQNQNGALVIYGGEIPLNPAASLDVSGTSFQGDGAPGSVGVNEIGGCLAPVAGTGPGTFQNLASNVSPSGCIAVTAVPEPRAFVLLLTGLFLTGVARRSSRMKGAPHTRLQSATCQSSATTLAFAAPSNCERAGGLDEAVVA